MIEESEAMKRLRERNIFEEIKKKVTQIKETKKEESPWNIHPDDNPSGKSLIDEILGE